MMWMEESLKKVLVDVRRAVLLAIVIISSLLKYCLLPCILVSLRYNGKILLSPFKMDLRLVTKVPKCLPFVSRFEDFHLRGKSLRFLFCSNRPAPTPNSDLICSPWCCLLQLSHVKLFIFLNCPLNLFWENVPPSSVHNLFQC